MGNARSGQGQAPLVGWGAVRGNEAGPVEKEVKREAKCAKVESKEEWLKEGREREWRAVEAVVQAQLGTHSEEAVARVTHGLQLEGCTTLGKCGRLGPEDWRKISKGEILFPERMALCEGFANLGSFRLEDVQRLLWTESGRFDALAKSMWERFQSVEELQLLTHSELRNEFGLMMFNDRHLVLERVNASAESSRVVETLVSARDAPDSDDEDLSVDDLLRARELQDFAERVTRALSELEMTWLLPMLRRGGWMTAETLSTLSHLDLEEMGVTEEVDRERTLQALMKVKPNESSSRIYPREAEFIRQKLQSMGLGGQVADAFERLGWMTLERTRILTHSELREAGVTMFSMRMTLLDFFRRTQGPGDAADEEPGAGVTQGEEADTIRGQLRSLNLGPRVEAAFETNGWMTQERTRQLTHADLRGAGVELFGTRARLLSLFQRTRTRTGTGDAVDDDEVGSQEANVSRDGPRSAWLSVYEMRFIQRVCRSLGLEETLWPTFTARGVTSLEKARRLTSPVLTEFGVESVEHRAEFYRVFRDPALGSVRWEDWKPRQRRLVQALELTGCKVDKQCVGLLDVSLQIDELVEDELDMLGLASDEMEEQRSRVADILAAAPQSAEDDLEITATKWAPPLSRDLQLQRLDLLQTPDHVGLWASLSRAGLGEEVLERLIQEGHESIESCRALQHRDLRAMGFRAFHERSRIIEMARTKPFFLDGSICSTVRKMLAAAIEGDSVSAVDVWALYDGLRLRLFNDASFVPNTAFLDSLRLDAASETLGAVEQAWREQFPQQGVEPWPASEPPVPEFRAPTLLNNDPLVVGVACDRCRKTPVNFAFHCDECRNFDLCWECFHEFPAFHEHQATMRVCDTAPYQTGGFTIQCAPS